MRGGDDSAAATLPAVSNNGASAGRRLMGTCARILPRRLGSRPLLAQRTGARYRVCAVTRRKGSSGGCRHPADVQLRRAAYLACRLLQRSLRGVPSGSSSRPIHQHSPRITRTLGSRGHAFPGSMVTLRPRTGSCIAPVKSGGPFWAYVISAQNLRRRE